MKKEPVVRRIGRLKVIAAVRVVGGIPRDGPEVVATGYYLGVKLGMVENQTVPVAADQVDGDASNSQRKTSASVKNLDMLQWNTMPFAEK
jgi:hypothetical protein